MNHRRSLGRSLLRSAIFVGGLVFGLLALSRDAHAEGETPAVAHERRPDYLFPAAGDFSLSLATGIPFLAMSEVGVGLTDRIAVGGLAGIAMSGDGPPTNVGFGLRPRFDVWDNGKNRVEIVVPTLYYPKTNGTWFLTRPSVQVEHRFASGAGLYGGVGLVAVMSEDALLGRTTPGQAFLPYGGTPGKSAGDASNGVWNTVSVGGAIPIGEKTHLFGEGALVLRGYELPGQEWVGGVPFTLTLGITTAL